VTEESSISPTRNQENIIKAFIYAGDAYIRCIPGKSLFHSTMVHEVVNRGDIFALRVHDQMLTIVPGNAAVTHYEMIIYERGLEPKPEAVSPGMPSPLKKLSALAKLQSIKMEIVRKAGMVPL